MGRKRKEKRSWRNMSGGEIEADIFVSDFWDTLYFLDMSSSSAYKLALLLTSEYLRLANVLVLNCLWCVPLMCSRTNE